MTESGDEPRPRTASATASDDAGRFRHLVEHIQDAVVEFEFVDGEPVVLGVNPAFVEVFGYEPEAVVGGSLNDFIVPRWLADEAETLDDRTSGGQVNYRRVRRETADGLRDFLYRGIPYEFADGRPGGFAVYTDLTEGCRNEDRLEVLNRLLRHNLRNRATLVLGGLEVLASADPAGDPATEQALASIREGATSLETLTREAGEIHRTLNEPVPDDPRVDCVSLLREVAGSYREANPRATIRTELPERLVVAATDRIEVAVRALVENAITHNPAESPGVWIGVRPVPDSPWADIVVADDGPEIPRVERAVVTGEAEITPLEHGSGLGLWLVKWTVERFGGELRFDASPHGGNSVELRLPRDDGA